MQRSTMKKLALGALAVAATALTASAESEAASAPAVRRMFVAIDKFDNKAGVEAHQFDTLRTRIQQAVVGTRKFEVVEREQLKNALSEQNLVAAGMTNGDDADAPEAGKLKAAGYVLYGNILFYGIDQSEAVGGGAGASSLRTKVELQLKITSAETGKLLAAKSVIGIGEQSRLTTAAAETSGNIREQCEREAVAQAAHRVVDALRDVCYPAKVVKVGKRSVVINMTNEEVAEGDLFDVIEAGEEMFDPDTGASLGSDGEDIGRVEIKRPGAKTSTAVPVGDLSLDDIEEGFVVRRVSDETLRKERAKAKKKRNDAFEARF